MKSMERVLTYVLAVGVLFPLSSYARQSNNSVGPKDRKPAANTTELADAVEVGKKVEETLSRVNAGITGGLALHSAVLNLETSTEVETGFELNLFIFTISHKRKKGHTETVALNFQRDTLDQLALSPSTADASSDDFLQQIKRAAAVASSVKTLPLNQISVKIEFAVIKDTQGSLSFKFFGGSASAGPSIDVTKTSINSLELVLNKARPGA